MTAPTPWLNEIAKGKIKTQWGQMMATANPSEEEDKVTQRLREKNIPSEVIWSFTTIAPLLAERLAIAQYAKKNPQIMNVAPEVLNYQEALSIATKEWRLTEEEQSQLMNLLKTDETMKEIM